jgi:glycine cleavage system H protein
MWIKPLADDKAAIGITDKLQELMGVVNSLDFPREGEVVAGGEFCGYAESWKMNVDFICPVSGTVLQVNTALQWGLGSKDHVFHIDPYVTGWMMVIQLSKPEELNGLLTPEEYIALNAKVAP